MSARRSGATTYYLFDALGSVDRLTDGGQNVVGNYIFKAFGEQLLAAAAVNPFRFIGELGYYYDADAGLYYVRARMLWSSSGRWLSEDPLGSSAGDDNLYRYVQNRPVVLTDPSGRQVVMPYEPVEQISVLPSTPSMPHPVPPPMPSPIWYCPPQTIPNQGTCPGPFCGSPNGINCFYWMTQLCYSGLITGAQFQAAYQAYLQTLGPGGVGPCPNPFGGGGGSGG